MTQFAHPKLSPQAVIAQVQSLKTEALAMLGDLVACPSLLGQEAAAQERMASTFADLGLAVEQFEIDETILQQHPAYSPSLISYQGRRNVVGTHQPRGGVRGRSLILNGHIDVVPVGDTRLWASEPFVPRVDGDRLYGRGAADMKAGIVAYVTAFKALQRLGVEPAAPVYMQSVIEEECTGNGALACLIKGYTADAALIPEPHQEKIMCAQMGVLWLTLEVRGVPVHASQAHTGISAIAFAQYLVDELRALEKQWNLAESRHPLYCTHAHPVNFNLGTLTGGEWTSSVPTFCRATVRLSFYPGMQVAQVKSEVEALLAAAHAKHPDASRVFYDLSYQGFQCEGLVVNMDEPVIHTLTQCHQLIHEGKEPQIHASTATTDVKFFHLYGNIPSTCYGPVGQSIHGVDEWVSISSMLRVASVYALFMAHWCGLNPLP